MLLPFVFRASIRSGSVRLANFRCPGCRMPSDRRCVWVRPSDRVLSALDAAVKESGVSRSVIVAVLLERHADELQDYARSMVLEGIQRRAVARLFQVAVSSTTATNSHG